MDVDEVFFGGIVAAAAYERPDLVFTARVEAREVEESENLKAMAMENGQVTGSLRRSPLLKGKG